MKKKMKMKMKMKMKKKMKMMMKMIRWNYKDDFGEVKKRKPSESMERVLSK